MNASSGGGALVSIAEVEKHFGSVAALQGVSLEAGAGEFLSLLGPSGSGKTTLLMMIAGFEIPDRGTISIGGRDVTEVPANRRDVGMVFQRYALFPHMTVAENIGFPLRMRGVAKGEIAARVDEALRLVRLEGYGARLPAQLSGGQQQRVALARAVVFRPPVLLMDEPLAALDKKLRQAMQLEVRQLQRQLGITVVYVTHDQEEALTMSDRIAVLNEGRIEQVGRPEELYETPLSLFVADFIGETNFLSGVVVGVEGDECRLHLDGAGTALGRIGASGIVPGGSASLAVRPDRIRLHDETGVEGEIVERIYSGASLTLAIRIGPNTVMARGASNGADACRMVGQRVRVSWQAQDGRVYAGKTAR